MKKIFYILLLLFPSHFLLAQQYTTSVEKFGIESGLSHNQINWIHKDRQGMMWIGAYNGINRYDGQEFKFVAEIGFMYSLNYEGVLEDHEGDLWIKKNGFKNELIFFNTITEKVKTAEEKFGQNSPISSTEYLTAIQLANQSFVIGTKNNELIHISPKGEVLQRYQLGFSLKRIHAHPNSNQFWIHSTKVKSDKIHLLLFNENLKPLLNFDEKKVVSHFMPREVTENNHLIFNNNKNVYDLTPEGVLTQKDYEIDNSLQRISISINFQKEKNLFINCRTGNIALHDFTGQDTPILTANIKELAISRIPNHLIIGDIIWFASVDGLIKLQIKKSPFKKAFYKNPEIYAQTEFISFRGIAADKKGNIIANGDGIGYRIVDSTVFFIGIEKGSKRNYDVFFDRADNLWYSEGGITFFENAQTGEIKKIWYDDPINSREVTWDYFQDKNGRIWAGTLHGLYYYDEAQSIFKRYIPPKEFESINKNSIYHIFSDHEERIWLASSKGLYLFDLEEGILGEYWTGGENQYSFPSDDIRHIHQDAVGIFWMATREGLLRWDKEKSKTQLFTTHDGLPHNVLNAIYEDDFGFLWMSSDNGIIQFQKSTLEIKNYSTADGITYPEFNRISHFQGEDGTIYFGGLNGVTYFHPLDFAQSFFESMDIPLILTECKIFSSTEKKQKDRLSDFNKNKKITLTPDDKFLSLEFALLDYHHSEPSQYVYEIDGEQWKVSKDNSINISSLPYGEHTLAVKGRSSNGLFSNKTLMIPIEVLKPFYLQPWFIGFGLFSILGVLVFYQKRKTKRYLQREEILENKVLERTQTIQNQKEKLQSQSEKLLQLNKDKSKFIANISHEFRTPLTLITNTLNRDTPNDDNKGKTFTFEENDINIMQRNANRLQQLIEQVLDLSKLEAGKMSLQASQNDFYTYLKNLVSTFQPLAKNKNIALNFRSDLENCPLYFDRDKMDKIVYNLLANAIKFTPENKHVNVLLLKNSKEVVLKIKDTGIGISNEKLPLIFDRFYRGKLNDEYAYKGTGLGLALVKDLAEIHHGKIEVESEIGKGTNFTIYFPLGDQHLEADEKIILKEKPTCRSDIKIEAMNLEAVPIPKENATLPILLIIEDNQDLLYHHQQNFQNDYQLLLAKDGQEGIDLAVEHLPDLVVCDVMMPKKNGYEVCQLLKLDERTNHIPIILLTAKAGHSEKMEGLMVGADEYLTKPYDQKELKIRLQNLLTFQKHLREKLNLQIDQPDLDPAVKTPQQHFLQKCKSIVEKNYTNPNFDVDEWGQELDMSRSNLFRKIKMVLGTTPMQFIRSYRLQKAKELLIKNVGNGSEVAYMVGFNNPNYFFKCFKEEYGMTVGDFIKT